MGGPAIDVIIPTYQRPERTQRAVASVQAQTFSDWGVILSDDGSDQTTTDALRALCSEQIRLVTSAAGNAGPQAARQRGLEHGSAPWVALLDSDDVWLPRKLECQVDASDDVDVVLCLHRWVGTQPKGVNAEQGEGLLPPTLTDNMSTPLFRRAALESAGGFLPPGVPSLRTCEHIELYVRLASSRYRSVPRHLVDCWSHDDPRASDGLRGGHAAAELAWVLENRADVLAQWPADRAALLGRLSARYFASGQRRRGLRCLGQAIRAAPQPAHVVAAYGPFALRSTFGRT